MFRNLFRMLPLACLFACFGFVHVFAQEPAVPVPAPSGETTLPSWLSFVLSFEFVWKGLATLLGLGATWIFKKLIDAMGENEVAKEAIRALEAAVTETYLEFVRQAKEASADGKLTAEEKKQAMDMTLEKVKEIAKGPALELLKKWGIPYLKHLIEKIISKKKAEAGSLPNVAVKA